MRTLTVMLAGAILGCAITASTILVAGGWYEYHLYHGGDPSVVTLVNEQGWEITLRSDELIQLRRPRFRLH